MKNSILALLLISSITFSCAHNWYGNSIKGNGNVITKTITTPQYDIIDINGSMDVHLEKGTEGKIRIKAEENLQELVKIEVKNNRLLISYKENTSFSTKVGIHITVPFEKISKLKLVGSGDIDTKDAITTDEFHTSVSGSGDIILAVKNSQTHSQVTGSGDITLTGSTENLNVNVVGSGDFKGFNLNSQNTTVTVTGSGDAKVNATKSINAEVNGSGDIVYKGNPTQVNTSTQGSGDITAMQ